MKKTIITALLVALTAGSAFAGPAPSFDENTDPWSLSPYNLMLYQQWVADEEAKAQAAAEAAAALQAKKNKLLNDNENAIDDAHDDHIKGDDIIVQFKANKYVGRWTEGEMTEILKYAPGIDASEWIISGGSSLKYIAVNDPDYDYGRLSVGIDEVEQIATDSFNNFITVGKTIHVLGKESWDAGAAVAGTSALMFEKFDGIMPHQIKNIIVDTARKIEGKKYLDIKHALSPWDQLK